MNKKQILNVLGVVLLLSITFGGVIFLKNKSLEECDTVVEMKDGTEYKCAESYHYDSGITLIVNCDGTKFKVPTRDIKIVKDIKK